MPLRAGCLLGVYCCRTDAAKPVDAVSYCFKVFRVTTPLVPAQMIDFITFGDVLVHPLVHLYVNINDAAVYVDLRVAPA